MTIYNACKSSKTAMTWKKFKVHSQPAFSTA